MTLVLHPYAGGGGASEGARLAGITDIGVEHDPSACATRRAAGHRTIRADAATFPLGHLVGQVDGLIVTPPCPSFSTAGQGVGRDVIEELHDAVGRGDWAWSHDDDRVRHVLEVGRWAETLRPRWIVCEQVPPVLPLWRTYAERWRARFGWSTWAGVLCAADFGVPQTRRRAFLIARTDSAPALPPEPTHCDGGAITLTGELAPWVTMADALGWDGCWNGCDPTPVGLVEVQAHGARRHIDEPAMTVTGSADNGNYRWVHGLVLDRRTNSRGPGGTVVPTVTVPTDRPAPTLTANGGNGQWVFRQPATTVAGDPRITARCHHDEGSQGARAVTVEQAMTGDYDGTAPIRLTVRDALTLQGFPPDYPVQGTRTAQFRQIGDAVPPPLAAAVIKAATR